MEKYNPEIEQKKAEVELLEKISETIADGAVQGYRMVENGVVTGHQKIEDAAVGGFTKISDQFVDVFLKKEGESVADAKARLAAEQRAREEKANAVRHVGPEAGHHVDKKR